MNAVDGKEIRLTVEYLLRGSDSKQELGRRMLTGSGKSVREAFDGLESSLAGELLPDHCGALLVSDGLNQVQWQDLLEFAAEQKQLNYSVFVVGCESASEFLKAPPYETAVGYDIMRFLKHKSKKSNCRFFECLSAEKNEIAFSLPYFTSDESGIFYRSTESCRIFCRSSEPIREGEIV